VSIEALKWADSTFKIINMPTVDRFVLVALCFRHNKKTGECYPSVKTIADYTGYSERCVQYSIKRLCGWGLISAKPRFLTGQQTSNQYFLFGVPKVSAASIDVTSGVHASLPPRGAPDAPPPMSSDAPNKEGIYTTSETDCGNVVRFPSQKKGFGDV
jgi:hypothetical protein